MEVYAKGGDVIGRRIEFPQFRGTALGTQIVGVIGDIREDSLEAPAYPYVYTCVRAGGWPDPEYVVRATGDPRALRGGIREVVRRIDPSRAIFGVRTMDEALAASLDRPRVSAEMLAAFALTAMGLAAVGLYSLVMQLVNSRRQEIGVRMALGASPAQILGSMLRGAGRLIAAGIAVGAALTIGAERLLHSLLFGVGSIDVVSVAGAAGLLGAVSLAAAFVPARRAAAIDPMESMRE